MNGGIFFQCILICASAYNIPKGLMMCQHSRKFKCDMLGNIHVLKRAGFYVERVGFFSSLAHISAF